MSEHVRLEIADGIATIRLDRPPMNALNAEIQRALLEAAETVSEDRDVAAVIVYGGPKVFAAGVDIVEMASMTYTEMADHSVLLQDLARAYAQIPKPTIAAITGYALGGGCELALACDFRISSKQAKLGQPEILLGVIPGAGGTQRLSRLIGPARAKDLIFTGRFVSADEALAMGMVDQVVDTEGADPADGCPVYAAARERMAAFVGGPAYALRAAKEAIDRGIEADLETGLQIERMLFAGCFATNDQKIGMASFVENGPGKARFTGS